MHDLGEADALWSRTAAIHRLVRRLDPDIVHSVLWYADIPCRLALAGRRSVCSVTSWANTPYVRARVESGSARWLPLQVTRLIDATTTALGVDLVHAVTPGVAEANRSALRISSEKVVVVHRGRGRDELGDFSEERRTKIRRSIELPSGAEMVLCVGRQERQKNLPLAIRAFAEIAAHREGALLCLAGHDGGDSSQIQDLVSELDLGDRVRFLGHRDDVADLLCAADVFVMSSWFEGAAGAVIEAFGLDCPVVATDVAGLRGVVCHRANSLVVPIDDSRALPRAPSARSWTARARLVGEPRRRGDSSSPSSRRRRRRQAWPISTSARLPCTARGRFVRDIGIQRLRRPTGRATGRQTMILDEAPVRRANRRRPARLNRDRRTWLPENASSPGMRRTISHSDAAKRRRHASREKCQISVSAFPPDPVGTRHQQTLDRRQRFSVGMRTQGGHVVRLARDRPMPQAPPRCDKYSHVAGENRERTPGRCRHHVDSKAGRSQHSTAFVEQSGKVNHVLENVAAEDDVKMSGPCRHSHAVVEDQSRGRVVLIRAAFDLQREDSATRLAQLLRSSPVSSPELDHRAGRKHRRDPLEFGITNLIAVVLLELRKGERVDGGFDDGSTSDRCGYCHEHVTHGGGRQAR